MSSYLILLHLPLLYRLFCLFSHFGFSRLPLPFLPAGPMISSATQDQTSFTITCPNVQGDYVRLCWLPPDNRRHIDAKQVYQYDRWRGSTMLTAKNKRLQLAGPPYNAETGSFSFLLTPSLKEGGFYTCEVFLNDNAFSQRTCLTVLKGTDQGEEEED